MTQRMFTVSALYHFTRFDDPAALRGPMLSLCEHEGIKGTILIAAEGVNGTIAGPEPRYRPVVAAYRGFAGLRRF